MATLPDTDRQRIWRGLMRAADFGGIPNVLKTDLKAAVDAADGWVDSNAASYNSALPTAFRTNATAGQKALLLVLVVAMRFGVDWLRRIAGEVD